MMQKVRGRVSAFLGLYWVFHFSFSVPLRYCLCCSIGPFPSSVLGRKNGLVILDVEVFGFIDSCLLFFIGG